MNWVLKQKQFKKSSSKMVFLESTAKLVQYLN